MTVAFDVGNVPALLQAHGRWVLWTQDGAGKKAPRAAAHPNRNCDATNASHWTSFPKAIDTATRLRETHGVGFALGPVQGGPAFAGVDLDKCRDPQTGVIEPWAQTIIDHLASYTEVSPSGTGVKVFLLGSLPDTAKQGKVYKVEIYDRGRYFTVTGNHLAGTPSTVEERTTQLRDLHSKVWSADLVPIARVFGLYLGTGSGWINIRCPWQDGHTPPSQPRDAGFKLDDAGKVVGFNCFHGGCSEKTLGDVWKFFGLKGGADSNDFIVDHNGKTLKSEPDNIRRALGMLGYGLRYDRFAECIQLTHEGETRLVTDAIVNRAWFAVNEKFKFLPSAELFHKVVEDEARAKPFHPVLDYLNGLRWDGKPRLDSWLIAYGGADDTPYVRAVGALPLMAAVRRVRQPGCKFDEMLVLESPQGTNKSSALATLCANPDWFSDDVPLGLDSKEVIERTGGKWFIEVGELQGMRHSEIERLKGFLSRNVDGPVRRAYGHISEDRPRQFVFIGTTNSSSYLRDSTGNRRFWPVRVQVFDTVNLRRDRDQLWAEAAVREAAPGESIRLPEHLWGAAATEQEARRQDDPWEDDLIEAVGDLAVVPVQSIWAVLPGASPSINTHAARITEIMQRLGYVKSNRKVDGKQTRAWFKVEGELVLRSEDSREQQYPRPAFVGKVSREA